MTVRERLSAFARKSLKRELGARGRHHRVPVWYHGELVGRTRYEHSVVRHEDVNCTGEAEDPQALLLMTTTTTINTTTTKASLKGPNKNSTQTLLKKLKKLTTTMTFQTVVYSLQASLILNSKKLLPREARRHTTKTYANRYATQILLTRGRQLRPKIILKTSILKTPNQPKILTAKIASNLVKSNNTRFLHRPHTKLCQQPMIPVSYTHLTLPTILLV